MKFHVRLGTTARWPDEHFVVLDFEGRMQRRLMTSMCSVHIAAVRAALDDAFSGPDIPTLHDDEIAWLAESVVGAAMNGDYIFPWEA